MIDLPAYRKGARKYRRELRKQAAKAMKRWGYARGYVGWMPLVISAVDEDNRSVTFSGVL
jgi:hypothetical protein